MRMILSDWLAEVHNKLELRVSTRLFCGRNFSKKASHLNVLLACKYEEIRMPEVNNFMSMSDNTYTHEHVLSTEKGVLREVSLGSHGNVQSSNQILNGEFMGNSHVLTGLMGVAVSLLPPCYVSNRAGLQIRCKLAGSGLLYLDRDWFCSHCSFKFWLLSHLTDLFASLLSRKTWITYSGNIYLASNLSLLYKGTAERLIGDAAKNQAYEFCVGNLNIVYLDVLVVIIWLIIFSVWKIVEGCVSGVSSL
ncbi:G2/mitotic-specific cyclin S13-6-like [Spinacia oleracea]|uniref:G2/mitotic-specific cyclin S13-6-like n=1 Tax=Spinacia oleracea TaxID=3562 RepID=A0ABM3R9C2_SPIOL|nr:G2/mitotic-specific cyclin S13-6-like [Spinacia oleracea]